MMDVGHTTGLIFSLLHNERMQSGQTTTKNIFDTITSHIDSLDGALRKLSMDIHDRYNQLTFYIHPQAILPSHLPDHPGLQFEES